MRLIVKQVRVNVDDEPNHQVRVGFTRNGKSLFTNYKNVNEETGVAEIKQSFNQKLLERFDNQND